MVISVFGRQAKEVALGFSQRQGMVDIELGAREIASLGQQPGQAH